MQERARLKALKQLRQAGKRVEAARHLLEAGDVYAAEEALAQARRQCGAAGVALLAGCLQRLWSACDRHDPRVQEGRVAELVRVLGFAWEALCPACRRQLGARLREFKR